MKINWIINKYGSAMDSFIPCRFTVLCIVRSYTHICLHSLTHIDFNITGTKENLRLYWNWFNAYFLFGLILSNFFQEAAACIYKDAQTIRWRASPHSFLFLLFFSRSDAIKYCGTHEGSLRLRHRVFEWNLSTMSTIETWDEEAPLCDWIPEVQTCFNKISTEGGCFD